MKILLQFGSLIMKGKAAEDYKYDESKTLEFSTIKKAQDKLKTLELFTDQKIRIIEYRNDESDKTRKACKVIEEKSS